MLVVGERWLRYGTWKTECALTNIASQVVDTQPLLPSRVNLSLKLDAKVLICLACILSDAWVAQNQKSTSQRWHFLL